MANKSSPSALVANQGTRVRLRLEGEYYQLSHDELRAVLKLPAAEPLGLGITIDKDQFCFEFADGQVAELSAGQLRRRLSKATIADAS